MISKHFRALSLLVVGSLVVGLFAFAPGAFSQAQAKPRNPLENIPVTGTGPAGEVFNGTLDIVSFAADTAGTGVVATGLINGTLRTAAGEQRVENIVVNNIPVGLGGAGNGADAPTRTCSILHLTLGPLDLTLLGIVIHLDRVNLTIDAVSGPGNLLGNLLCAIAGLLDGGPLPTVLGQVVGLLNRIIDLLG